MRRLLIILSLIVLFFLGLKSFILQFPFEWPRARYAELLDSLSLPVRVLLALLATALPVAVGVEFWMRHPARRKLTLKGHGGGHLELRQSVIEKIVRQSVAELPEIDKLRVTAHSSRGGLRIKIHVKARDVRCVPDLDEAIRLRADQSLRRVLGIEEIHSVEVSLEDMNAYERSSPGAGAIEPPAYPPARSPLDAESEPRPEPATDLEPESDDESARGCQAPPDDPEPPNELNQERQP